MELLRKYSKKHFFERMIASSLMCYMFFNALFSVALAGPEGAQVVNGQVSFQQSGYNTTITASDKAIINYSSFNITRPEIVEFIQPNSNASVLNRILSANPTNINGTLLANGRVFFVNPAGVYIGAGARVNVNQLVASGLNITNSDFINGRYNFAGGDGSVINSGDISARKVYLIGRQVANSGSIHCPAGYVVMAAGDGVFLSEPGSDVMVEVDPQTVSDPAALADSGPGVLSQGEVDAAGGRIVLAAGDIHTQAISNVGSLAALIGIGGAGQISNTGTIEARSDTATGGTVIAKAAEVTNSGTVDVTGSEGGKVAMEATGRLGQFGTIHADGTDSHGGSVELTAGDVVALSSDSLTTANAGTNGDGGEIIVYSPDTALFHDGAIIEAKGGSESGDGGFVEVSGKEHVEVFGLADVSANNGDGGTFFIDPHNVTIQDGAGTLDSGGNPFAAGSDGDTVSDDAIEGVINTGGAAVVQTSDGGLGDGDIIQDADATIDFTGAGGDASLTLNAADDVELNGGIAVTGATATLTVAINANGAYDTASGGGDVDINADIATNGGSFTSSGVDFDNAGGTISTGGGKVDIQNTGNVTIGAAINTGAGDVDIDGGTGVATSIIDGGGTITSSGTITLEASGNIGNIGREGAAIDTVSTGTINASSTVAGDIYINNNGAVTLGTVSTAASDIVINNSGDLSINSMTAGGRGDIILNSTGDITTKTLSTTTGNIFVRSQADLILGGPVTSGGRIKLESQLGNIEAQELKATGDIHVESWAGLILGGPVTSSGGWIKLINTEENIKAQESTETGYISVPSLKGLILGDPVTSGGRIALESNEGKVETQKLDATLGNIFAESKEDLIINGLVESGSGITLLNDEGKIETKKLTTATGDIIVRSEADLILGGPVTSGGRIELESELGNIEAQKLDATRGNISALSQADLILGDTVASGGGITLLSEAGNIEAQKLDATGNISAVSPKDLILSGPVSSKGGGVKLIVDTGKIYTGTSDWADDTLNVPITGYSDGTKGVGLLGDTPDHPAKAAIVIESDDDLKLGSGAILTANGNYKTGIDDKQAVRLEGGDPIDIAIYIRSYPQAQGRGRIEGNVTIDSAVSIYPGSTMVIDARDTVNDFGENFKNSWTNNDRKNGLEVCSRTTQTLDHAVSSENLPHAMEASEGRVPPWFTGSKYILRGSSEGKVLSMAEPVTLPSPLDQPSLLPSQQPKGPDKEELMRWLEEEGITPYFEGAHPEILSTDLRFLKAAQQLRDYDTILNGTTDAQIEELTKMLAEIVQPGSIALSIAWFDRQLRVDKHRDEVLYAKMCGEWIDALIGYTKTLNTQFGWPIDNCIEKVMRDYVRRIEIDDHRFFVQKYILSVLGVEDRPIFLASLRAVDCNKFAYV